MEIIKDEKQNNLGNEINRTDKGYKNVVKNNQLFEMMNRREWLSTEEAGEYLRMSANAIRIRVHRGQIIPHRFGRSLRFKPAELDALIKMVGE
jgi:excisionase family DNA binding protein